MKKHHYGLYTIITGVASFLFQGSGFTEGLQGNNQFVISTMLILKWAVNAAFTVFLILLIIDTRRKNKERIKGNRKGEI